MKTDKISLTSTILRPLIASTAIVALAVVLVFMPEYQDYGHGILFCLPLVAIFIFAWLHRNLHQRGTGFWEAALASVPVTLPFSFGLLVAMTWVEQCWPDSLWALPMGILSALVWGIPLYLISPAIYVTVSKARLRQVGSA